MFNDITTAYTLRDATGEILIMLLVAFLLGYLLRYFLESKKEVVEVHEPMSVYLGKDFSTDDLKIVEGIGPKIEELLKTEGIKDWEMLAAAPVEILQRILADAGERYRMHNPNTWPEQAALAYKGMWKELKDYQDFLIGGV